MDYTNPYTGGGGYFLVHQFTPGDRTYEVTKQVSIPYTTKYCLMVNYVYDWEVRISQ